MFKSAFQVVRGRLEEENVEGEDDGEGEFWRCKILEVKDDGGGFWRWKIFEGEDAGGG